jgi:hypothetical protein
MFLTAHQTVNIAHFLLIKNEKRTRIFSGILLFTLVVKTNEVRLKIKL